MIFDMLLEQDTQAKKSPLGVIYYCFLKLMKLHKKQMTKTLPPIWKLSGVFLLCITNILDIKKSCKLFLFLFSSHYIM